jgi:hypothetical protein
MNTGHADHHVSVLRPAQTRGEGANGIRAAPTSTHPSASPILEKGSADGSPHAIPSQEQVGKVTAAELPWLAGVVLATLALVEIPHVLAYGHEAQGFMFTGVLWWAYDFPQYAAAMREGAAGPSWLVHDHLTGEPHRPVFMYALYVGLGKLARLLELDPQPAFRALSLVARALLLGAFYVFCGAIFGAVHTRRVAFVLILFSSALGIWLLLFRSAVPSGFADDQDWSLAIDMKAPELTTFLLFFTAPHLMLGLALQLFAAVGYLKSWSNPTLRAPVLTALATLGVGLANPFGLVTLCAVLVVHLALMWSSGHRVPRRAILSVVAAAAAAAPFAGYALLIFGADPFWGAVYGRQNATFSPSPPLLALGLAPVLALGALGFRSFIRSRAPERWLVIVCILVILGLMYAPVAVQRRFALGLHPMLALVAALGLERIWQARRRSIASGSRPNRLVAFGLGLILFGSTIGTYGLVMQFATRPTGSVAWAGVFQPAPLSEAGRWLAGVMGPDDVVLGELMTGNYLAGVVPGRAFVGHPVATLEYESKAQAARRFYREDQDSQASRHFLAAHNIRYVVYGPHERGAGAPPPTGGYLKVAFATPDVSILEVED